MDVKRTLVIAGLVACGVVAWVWQHPSESAPQPDSQTAREPSLKPAALATSAPVALPTAPAPAPLPSSAEREASSESAPSRPEKNTLGAVSIFPGGPMRSEIDLPHLREMYERWSREPEDPETSSSAFEKAKQLLSKGKLDPLALRVRCARDLCRAEIAFDTLKELRNMGMLKREAGQVVVGMPEAVQLGPGMVMYWERGPDGHPLMPTNEDSPDEESAEDNG